MKKGNIVKPVGLKGNQVINRMKELMGATSINENTTGSVVELTKEGPDGKIYAVIRENHEYYSPEEKAWCKFGEKVES